MKAVTLNLANYDDDSDWDQRAEMIAEVLIDLDADLVAFQEVRFNPDQPSTSASYQNMAEQVLHAIRQSEGGEAWEGTTIVTQPAMYYPQIDGEENPWEYPQPSTDEDDAQEWEGLTILSRDGVFETGSVFLSQSEGCTDNNRRITQYAATKGFDEPLHFFNTHFAFREEVCRESNAEETLAYMSRFDGFQLLVGDLNAEPDDPALQLLRDAGLVDLWQELQGNDPGYTYASDDPTKRIDYCWANQALAVQATGIELIATQPAANGVYASDHFGLCVTFDA